MPWLAPIPVTMATRTFAAAVMTAAVLISGPAAAFDMADIPGATYIQGDAEGDANEAPRPVTVAPFRIMVHEVTNAEFRAFAAAAGHLTDVERAGGGYVWTDKWRLVAGADWRHPHGPGSVIDDRDDHPVVQASARDAAAFCAYFGLRLPTDAEWEFAARGGDGRRYPWGMAAPEQPSRRANFGTVSCCAADGSDGYARTAPVGRFAAGRSPFGLNDMAGNVWEWTASEFPGRPGMVALRGGGWGNDPYCLRVSYRHWNPSDIGLDMVGFRCAGDAL